ncbi:hypothetical protein MMC14_002915 [Varicellaria rhodocarpa]|nr:hypothetical protein [Varicellaria rhodocarpa]
MGKLIKNHWARLIVLTAACVQMGAAFEGFFWPKIFWDHFTHGLDGAVKPVPILQIINMILGIFTFAFEYPVGILTNNSLHRSIVARMVWIPFTATAAVLLYQGPDACGWYLIGLGAYGWAYMEGESICPVPWTLPRKPTTGKAEA